MTKYHQIRDERMNLESHQFLMNSCFSKRILRKIKVVQKMDLDKNLKTHQISPISYISVDDFCGLFTNEIFGCLMMYIRVSLDRFEP